LQEVANLMERLFAAPYAELTPESVAAVPLSAGCRARLPDARLSVAVVPTAGPPPGKQVSVEIVWRGHHGQPARPVRLTAWRYATEVTP
jgi:hypothetical protein